MLGDALDLLEHPDPHTAAETAAVENLLRCWVREANLPASDNGILRIPLPASGTALLVPVHYWSATGWHRFGIPYLADTPDRSPPAVAVTVAALLTRETLSDATLGVGPVEHTGIQGPEADPAPTLNNVSPPTPAPAAIPPTVTPTTRTAFPALPSLASAGAAHVRPQPSAGAADLVGRVADSVRRTGVFLGERRKHLADAPDLFLAAEQALVLGHPLHPTPKSREGLSEAEARLYSPELRGSFPLRWLAVAPSVLATDSAWTERGRPVAAAQLTARLAGAGMALPDGYAALPLHPWQLREVRHRPEAAALFDAGLLQDLGTHGVPWHPTSSLRTVHRSDAPAMLKLSLGLRITNSRRENLRKELHRGVEVHRLLRSGLAGQWHAAHPGFDIVRDPAWLAVDGPGGDPMLGLDVMIRHNPFSPSDDVSCIAGLVSPRPRVPAGTLEGGQDADRPALRSRLAEVVTRLAGRTGRPRGTIAAEWFLRYLEQVVRPVLWLDAKAGIALEAHQQNTLLLLDGDGWPVGGRYRDNQGYYFRTSRRAELDARLSGIGEHSDTFVSDEVTDERFTYYLAINNVLGLIGAFGSQRLADEQLLLAAFRRFLTDVASGPARLSSTLPSRLLDSPVLRCKANLLTRLHGLDELAGPVDTQSVYVTIANPLHP
ncbi:siderophore synthetase component [Streptomyces sp. LBL]|uniref:IucA/IucC family protein n=1 Tax=Streptomyces sp. LBL TaxID=2940562 RepID=UPI002475D4C2|nr:IucA/IucC family protein [Streptomyces sp. LBL]MDH6629636.1 siderophore synthetase component [Streptomyces sp. LBL]